MRISFAVASLLVGSASASNCPGGQHAWQTASGCSEFAALDGYYGTPDLCALLKWTEDSTQCPTFDTSLEAEEFCDTKGLKLCSVTELEMLTDNGRLTNNILNSQCSMRDNNIFTSTPCEGDGSGNNVITMAGKGTNKQCRAIDSSGSNRRAMCCGRRGPKCRTCPRGTFSPRQADYLRQCAAGPRMHRVFPAGVYDEFGVDYDAPEFRTCPAGFYASGSAVSCPEGVADYDWKIAIGENKYPADTKSTDEWWKKDADSSVCAKTHSLVDGIYCDKYKKAKKSYAEATSVCMANGARLCTVTELENDDTSGTGCNYNWKAVWSDTPCELDNGGSGFIVTSGQKKHQKKIGKKCRDPTWNQGVTRCCADDLDQADPYPTCKACPDGYTSPPGAALVSECVLAGPFTCPDGSEYRAGSSGTCETLSATNMYRDTGLTNEDGAAVCAGGKDAYGRCSNKRRKKTQPDAAAECESEGARLCTWDEIRTGAGATSVCYSLRDRVWTSTKATGGYVIGKLNGDKYDVANPSSKAKVFCCADSSSDNNDANAGYYCAGCPSNNNGAIFGGQAQNIGVYQCSPDEDFSAVYPITGGELRFEEPELPGGSTSCSRDKYKSYSGATCGELGYGAIAGKYGTDDKVCSKAVRVPRSPNSNRMKCANQMTFTEASAACSASGMRMCTVAELYDGEGTGAGCDLGSKLVWTSTECPSGDAYFLRSANAGDSDAFFEARCGQVSTDVAYPLCCADTEVHCKDCPVNTATAGGSNSGGAEFCLCESPFDDGPNGCGGTIVYARIPGSVSRKEASSETSFVLDLATTTLSDFRTLVSTWSAIPTDVIVLTFGGTELTGDSTTLADFGIEHLHEILVVKTCEAYGNEPPYFEPKYACGNTQCGAGKYLSGSTLSCNTLGIDVKIKQAYYSPSTGVVGGSLINRQSDDYFCGTAYDPVTQQCMPEEMTFFEAKNYCEAKGMRTCGTQEIISNIPNDAASKANGCWPDDLQDEVMVFWSHKPCAEDPNAAPTLDFSERRREDYAGRRIRYYAQATGNNLEELPEVSELSKCLPGDDDATETARVACCADDTPVDTQFCRVCPANSCADHDCPLDATSNIDCICDDSFASYWFFNASLDRERNEISRPVCNFPTSQSPTTSSPSATPSTAPTSEPTSEPTVAPTAAPTSNPTMDPTLAPSPPATNAPIPAVAGIFVCDHINGGPVCAGNNVYFIQVSGDPQTANKLNLNNAGTRCYKDIASSQGTNDLLSLINLKMTAQYGKTVTEGPDTMVLTHDEAGRNTNKGSATDDAVLPCQSGNVDLFDLDVLDQDTLHLWPWTYCPTNTYRWGSRLPCNDNSIPWSGVTQSSLDFGPFNWGGAWKVCRGWSMPSPPGTYEQAFDVAKAVVSDDYRSPLDSGDDGKICVQATSMYNEQTGTSDPQCSGRVTWDEAKEFCYNIGARLCTQEELELSCAERTGCDYDYTFIWGKDECTYLDGSGATVAGHLSSPGDQRKWFYRNFKHNGAPHPDGGSDYMGGNGFGCGIALPNDEDPSYFKNSAIDPKFNWAVPLSYTPWDGVNNQGGSGLPWYYTPASTPNRYPYFYCAVYDTSTSAETTTDEFKDPQFLYMGSSTANPDTVAWRNPCGRGPSDMDCTGGETRATELGMADNGHGIPAGAPYKSMFYDLFGADMGWSHIPASSNTYDADLITFDPANKIITDNNNLFADFGIFCYPDDRKLFVRCCADHLGSQCRACPSSTSRTRGAEDFIDVTDFFNGNDGVNAAAWGTQTCS